MTGKWWPVSNDQLVGRIRLRSLSFARPMHLSQANTLGASFGEETMRAKLQDVIYPGNLAGTWEMYNNKVENEYTTIIAKRGQDLKQRARGSREEFVGKTWASVLALWCLGLHQVAGVGDVPDDGGGDPAADVALHQGLAQLDPEDLAGRPGSRCT